MNLIKIAESLVEDPEYPHEVAAISATFLALVDHCKEVLHCVHTQKGSWPGEVDDLEDFLKGLE